MTGQEDAYIELYDKTFGGVRLHAIKKTILSRKKGKVARVTSMMFPGYLFFQCDQEYPPSLVVRGLKRTRNFVRILPATNGIKPLSERDSTIIRHLVSYGQTIGTSLVTFDENNRIKVIQGPLAGLEGMIVKVDRRKRRAKVRLDLNNSPITFDLGFEMLETTPREGQ
ncbi:MAG: transcriptional antiterminator NusG [Spirochaetes bacterium]|nr:MAG: transcriptional antiterminator NusG [Spirochaetota bacterium]